MKRFEKSQVDFLSRARWVGWICAMVLLIVTINLEPRRSHGQEKPSAPSAPISRVNPTNPVDGSTSSNGSAESNEPNESAASDGAASSSNGAPSSAPASPASSAPTAAPGQAISNPLASLPAGARVAVIPIKEAITPNVYQSVKQRIEKSIRQGAQVLVFQIDSSSGDLDVALMVAEEIRRAPVSTVAWIDRQALGPSALIVSACHEIIVGPGPAVGVIDALVGSRNVTAVLASDRIGPVMQAIREGSQRSGVPFAGYHAMALPGVELFLVTNSRTGEKRLVNQADYSIFVEGKDPDQVNAAELARLAAQYGLQAPTNPQEKLKLPDGTEIDALSLGAVLSDDPSAVQQMGQWTLDRKVHNGKVAWALTDPDITALGFSKGQAGTNADIQSRYQASTVIEVDETWPESLAYWLISGPVRAALILMMVIGLFVEMKMPGLGFGGAVALICAVILVGAPFLVGLASFWHVAVFILGIILLAVEIFVLPGFGVAGITGMVLILLGLILLIMPTGPGGGYQSMPSGLITRLLISTSAWTLAGILGGLAGLFLVMRLLPDIPGANRLILQKVQPSSGSVDTNENGTILLAGAESGISGDEALGQGRINVGSVGFVTGSLRPAGLARFGNDTVDVVATTGWVEAGSQVKVTQIEGNRIYVEPVDQATV